GHLVESRGASDAHMDTEVVSREIARPRVELPRERFSAGEHLDARAYRENVGRRSAEAQYRPVAPRRHAVQQDLRRRVLVGHRDVEASVTVVIGEGGPPALPVLHDLAATVLRDVLERPVA